MVEPTEDQKLAERKDQKLLARRQYLKPVAWLLSRDLLANVKYFLLSAALNGKFDPRDLMKPEVFSFGDYDGPNHIATDPGSKEFWFDYFADCGDGMTAGYSLAYLSMCDLQLQLNKDWNDVSQPLPVGGKLGIECGALLAHISELRKQGADPESILHAVRRKASPEVLAHAGGTDLIAFIEMNAIGAITPIPQLEVKAGEVVPDKLPPECMRLPRGAFLFVGGDTSYHVADYASLGGRFQTVFEWAYKDLLTDKLADRTISWEQKRRPIFGVPGNHDYYDMLDGFGRQFRRAITGEFSFLKLSGRSMTPQLRLRAFKRFQTASYIALQLPFDWWFWSVDSELASVDIRQQEFFKRSLVESRLNELRRELQREPEPEELEARGFALKDFEETGVWPMPAKLIVATSEPTTVDGRRSGKDEKTSRAFSVLNLTRPFLYRGLAEIEGDWKKAEQETNAHDPACRLDISGDTHYYARYWGDDTQGLEGGLSAPNYASVVSGGGGASMSPTHADAGEVKAQTLYPSKELATKAINQRLFNPWFVARGGKVWLIGMTLATLVYFGANYPESHHRFTSALLDRVPGISSATFDLEGTFSQSLQALKLASLLLVALVAILSSGSYSKWLFKRLTKTHDWAKEKLLDLQINRKEGVTQKIYGDLLDKIEDQSSSGDDGEKAGDSGENVSFGYLIFFVSVLLTGALWSLEMNAYRPEHSSYGPLYIWGFLVHLLFSGLCIFFSFRRSKITFDKFQKVVRGTHGAQEKITAVTRLVVLAQDYLPFWGLVLFGVGNFSLVLYEAQHAGTYGTLPPFGRSVCFLLAIGVVVAAIATAMQYSQWLFEQAYRITVTVWSYMPVTVLSIVSVFFLGLAIWFFGGEVRTLAVDKVFLIALLVNIFAPIAGAVFVGNPKRKFVFLLLGFWNAILLLAVPFLLVWHGNVWALALAPIIVIIVALLSFSTLHLIPENKLRAFTTSGKLAVLWLLYGAGFLLLPILLHREGALPFTSSLWHASTYSPWHALWGSLLAGAFGALMSCVWLGWYFAVAVEFGGHAGDAGSAARREEYKQFIRFRITPDTLTGYVIGIDQPQEQGRDLKPRLVDTFTLRCSKAKAQPANSPPV